MLKTPRHIVFALIIATAMILCASPQSSWVISGQSPLGRPSDRELVFEDEFENPPKKSKKSLVGTEAQFTTHENGCFAVVVAKSEQPAPVWFGPPVSNFECEVRFRITRKDGDSVLHVAFRDDAQPSKNDPRLEWSIEMLDGQLRLKRRRDVPHQNNPKVSIKEQKQLNESKDLGLCPQGWNTLRLKAIDNNLELSLNGYQQHNVKLQGDAYKPGSRKIEFRATKQSPGDLSSRQNDDLRLEFDYIRVWNLNASGTSSRKSASLTKSTSKVASGRGTNVAKQRQRPEKELVFEDDFNDPVSSHQNAPLINRRVGTFTGTSYDVPAGFGTKEAPFGFGTPVSDFELATRLKIDGYASLSIQLRDEIPATTADSSLEWYILGDMTEFRRRRTGADIRTWKPDSLWNHQSPAFRLVDWTEFGIRTQRNVVELLSNGTVLKQVVVGDEDYKAGERQIQFRFHTNDPNGSALLKVDYVRLWKLNLAAEAN